MFKTGENLAEIILKLGARLNPRVRSLERTDGDYLHRLKSGPPLDLSERLNLAAETADRDLSAALFVLAAIVTALKHPEPAAQPADLARLRAMSRAWTRVVARDFDLSSMQAVARPRQSVRFGHAKPLSTPASAESVTDMLPAHLVAGPPVLAHNVNADGDEDVTELNALTKPVPRVRLGDVDRLIESLTGDAPWLAGTIDELLGPLKVDALNPGASFKLAPTLLVGPPGAGKSALIDRLAKTANVPVFSVQAGGSFENGALAGIPKGWRQSTPSLPIRAIAAAKIGNPLIVVDELDKVSTGNHNYGRLEDMLLAMIEPSTCKRWPDPSLQVEADLSGVSWVLLANDATRLSGPLRSRVRLLQATGPTSEHVDFLIACARTDLARGAGRSIDLTPELEPAARAQIAQDLDRHRDIRRVMRAVRAALSAAIWPSAH